VELHVVNWSGFPVKVIGVAFTGPSAAQASPLLRRGSVSLPCGHTASRRRNIPDALAHPESAVPEGELVAWARLATGEEFRADDELEPREPVKFLERARQRSASASETSWASGWSALSIPISAN
jgi:hypothetical protein